MPEIFTELFNSKKFIASIAGGLAVILAMLAPKLGFPLEEAQANQLAQYLAALVGAFVVAQGAADHGKEAEVVKAIANGGLKKPEDAVAEEVEPE